ncbi:MAG TPA: hypothetical protein VFU22_18430, partial [Roseiflexaceae bacterium]|nr:hypothetical protein [Roseiflexaceae bacterium]
MRMTPIGRISNWSIGAACIVSLAACGNTDQRGGAPSSAATRIAANTTPASGAEPSIAPDLPPAEPAFTPTLEQTAAPEQPTSQPRGAAVPTAQVAATLSPASAPVEIARADLARRRSVAPDTIRIVEVRDVVWPDLGLGCPQPGMAYKQVQVDGLLIRLESGGRIFEYHSGGGKPPFLCEQPTGADMASPVPGGE